MINDVRQIQIYDVYRLFPDFDKRFHLKENYIIYCLFDDGKPVSCLSYATEGVNFAKIHACFTPRGLRKRGYFKSILKWVIQKHDDRTIKADCLPDSFGVFEDCGFEYLGKEYCKGYTLYKTVLRREKGKYGKTKD